jgi:rod shape-determining protein MreD
MPDTEDDARGSCSTLAKPLCEGRATGVSASTGVIEGTEEGPLGLGYTHTQGDSEREGRLEHERRCRGNQELSTYPMSVLAPAVGAVLAAILESSVLTHLGLGGVTPDLVFAVGVAVAMVLGFESGMTWAFAGGIALDLLLPGRALGSTTLTLLLVIAAALLIARAAWPPRLVVVGAAAFALTFVYQALLLALLVLTVNVAFAGLTIGNLVVGGIANAFIAVAAVLLLRALDLRFGEPERVAW